MNALTTFKFEDRPVRSLMQGDQPWFVGKDVCDVLAIKNNRHALSRLADDERSDVAIGDGRGSDQRRQMALVNEPGVFRLIFTSRVPAAERFKRWLAHEVLPALRKTGRFEMGAGIGPGPSPEVADDLTAQLHRQLETNEQKLRLALTMINEARRTWNKAAARRLWLRLGLPDVGGAGEAVAADAEAKALEALCHLLRWLPDGVTPVAALLDRPTSSMALLRDAGLRIIQREDGDWLAIGAHPKVDEIFADTPWREWRRLLPTLPGAERGGPLRFGSASCRAVLLPETIWRRQRLEQAA